MQFIRRLGEEEFLQIGNYFELVDSPFLYPVMFKGNNRATLKKFISFDRRMSVYFSKEQETKTAIYYSDPIVADARRLREFGWKFQFGEYINAERAAALFHPMGIMRNPIMMYIPEVPVYRYRTKTLAARVQEHLNGTELKSFEIMNDEENRQFCQRDPSHLPIAEDFLRPIGNIRRKPFVYSVVEANRVLYKLHKFELKRRKAN